MWWQFTTIKHNKRSGKKGKKNSQLTHNLPLMLDIFRLATAYSTQFSFFRCNIYVCCIQMTKYPPQNQIGYCSMVANGWPSDHEAAAENVVSSYFDCRLLVFFCFKCMMTQWAAFARNNHENQKKRRRKRKTIYEITVKSLLNEYIRFFKRYRISKLLIRPTVSNGCVTSIIVSTQRSSVAQFTWTMDGDCERHTPKC